MELIASIFLTAIHNLSPLHLSSEEASVAHEAASTNEAMDSG